MMFNPRLKNEYHTRMFMFHSYKNLNLDLLKMSLTNSGGFVDRVRPVGLLV